MRPRGTAPTHQAGTLTDRHLSEHAHCPGAGPEVIEAAAGLVGAAATRREQLAIAI